jgi:hypothetical protein
MAKRSQVILRYEPLGESGKKLDMIREAALGEFPTADIDAMLAEVAGITRLR